MSSPRQIDANRRNAQLSTGPLTPEGKQRSRRNAIRHGLTAETIIGTLEDAKDYAAFEIAITADFEATSAVERELVLRLASLLWRLRRATAIESGLFRIQAHRLLQLRQTQGAHQERQKIINGLYRDALANAEPAEIGAISGEPDDSGPAGTQSSSDNVCDFDDLTRSYIRLANLPTCPLDRLSRYEATLWRQACQILLTLQFMSRPKRWARVRLP
jgi:hypothetical protein